MVLMGAPALPPRCRFGRATPSRPFIIIIISKLKRAGAAFDAGCVGSGHHRDAACTAQHGGPQGETYNKKIKNRSGDSCDKRFDYIHMVLTLCDCGVGAVCG